MTMVAPSARLAPFVRAFMVVEVRDETWRVRLPEPGLVLGVRYRGSASVLAGDASARLPDLTLTGLAGTARRMRTAAGGGVVLAMFHPAGATQFFAEPLHELFDATVALDQLVQRGDVDRVASQVADAADHAERVAALEAFLVARMRPQQPDRLVATAVGAIHEARGGIRIGALAKALAISQDPLEKRFRRVVGASPKQFASLLRLRYVVDAYRPGASLTRLALDAGYFDQSHFIREFRAVTGEAPGRFLRVGEHR
ncbi:MAG: helix-turn-helix domain-containing protein [Myxococcaceae bacterium]|nr:helix-turn-helix domain-containing protein [Myxococcaceae bacterium]MCI0674112.1 helix-turn-helix domain-containing protein [Myxococcaceae bacterium]